MRVLGILIVCWGIGTAVLTYVTAKYIRPALLRKHMAQLERENAEMDRQLDAMLKEKGKQ